MNMQTNEEIFRIKGREIAKLINKNYGNDRYIANLKFIKLELSILNKEELQELINWLIQKSDEME